MTAKMTRRPLLIQLNIDGAPVSVHAASHLEAALLMRSWPAAAMFVVDTLDEARLHIAARIPRGIPAWDETDRSLLTMMTALGADGDWLLVHLGDGWSIASAREAATELARALGAKILSLSAA
jgi:hypothetical protein